MEFGDRGVTWWVENKITHGLKKWNEGQISWFYALPPLWCTMTATGVPDGLCQLGKAAQTHIMHRIASKKGIEIV